VHANLPAFEAVLDDIRAEGVDEVWNLGDLVGYGAQPDECVALAAEHCDLCLVGNHDLVVLGKLDMADFSAGAAAAAQWTRERIGREALDFLSGLEPVDEERSIGLYHASPRDPVWEYVTEVHQARAALEDCRAPLTLIGHTHVPFAWRLTTDGAIESVGVPRDGRLALDEGRWLVNPGSVGQPRDDDARAAWALYDAEAGAMEFRRTPYDVAAAQNAILQAGLPELLAHRLAEGR